MEATSSGSMEIPTSASEEKCKWQKELQKLQTKVKTIKDTISSHEVTSFEEEASNASREWNKKLKEKLQTFHVIPLFFEMKELKILVEDEIRGRDPSKVVKKEIEDLKKRIVQEIKNELRVKYKKEDVEREVHQLNVKEYVDKNFKGDINKYLAEKSENKVEKALCKIMTGKPGLLRRGFTWNKKTFNLKNMIGQMRPEICKLVESVDKRNVETDLILL